MSSDSRWVEWIVLTTGGRPTELIRALESVDSATRCLVFNGGGSDVADFADVRMVRLDENVGVPAGRHLAASCSEATVVAFLDDDARASPPATERLIEAFEADPALGAVSLRLVDEDGETAAWHVPRPGGRRPNESGDVALFLGGACAIRREAYEEVGGYYTDLFYGHEELELSWRLIDAGWKIRYLADVEVFHPKTTISRHADGWRLTGRNRVLIARRTLPWPVAAAHVTTWLLVGTVRARREGNARAYLSGWKSGWRHPVDRAPISWRGVWRLTKLGRPPII